MRQLRFLLRRRRGDRRHHRGAEGALRHGAHRRALRHRAPGQRAARREQRSDRKIRPRSPADLRRRQGVRQAGNGVRFSASFTAPASSRSISPATAPGRLPRPAGGCSRAWPAITLRKDTLKPGAQGGAAGDQRGGAGRRRPRRHGAVRGAAAATLANLPRSSVSPPMSCSPTRRSSTWRGASRDRRRDGAVHGVGDGQAAGSTGIFSST